MGLLPFSVTFLFVLLHDSARRHFFSSSAIAAFLLGALLDVFVLALLFGAHARKMLLLFTAFTFCRHLPLSLCTSVWNQLPLSGSYLQDTKTTPANRGVLRCMRPFAGAGAVPLQTGKMPD